MIEEYRRQEQATNLSTHTPEPLRRINYICYDDDDDYDYKESTLTLNEINSQIPPSIVITTSPPVLPIEDPENDFTYSDDESLSDEDVPEENFKIYSNALFEFNDEYISNDVNPLFDEVLENIENKDSYDSNLDEPDLPVTPLSDANE
nr:hypothetical protein [Tanacetum cinerariifolium]